MKTGNVMIGSIGATGVNPMGDIYALGSFIPPAKGTGYYITIKRLGGGKRETILTTQIFDKEATSANMYKSAVKAASAAGLIPKYTSGDPVAFWEKHGGLKKNIAFDSFRKPKSSFNKSHRGEARITTI
jgi:hypothetical protein